MLVCLKYRKNNNSKEIFITVSHFCLHENENNRNIPWAKKYAYRCVHRVERRLAPGLLGVAV